MVIKELKSRDRKMFKNEISMMKRSRHFNDNHLARLVFTMQINGPEQSQRFFTVTPLADGNLNDFWRWNNPHEQKEWPQWVARQCHGLALALSKLHDIQPSPSTSEKTSSSSLHGNIKPTNLLWFRPRNTTGRDLDESGVLRISEYGASSMQRVDSWQPRDLCGGTVTYLPPEAEIDGYAHGSTSSDIWSLGCVFLELLCWLVLGSDETLATFPQSRRQGRWKRTDTTLPDTFYHIISSDSGYPTKAAVNPAVTQVRRSSPPRLFKQLLTLPDCHKNPKKPTMHKICCRLAQDHPRGYAHHRAAKHSTPGNQRSS